MTKKILFSQSQFIASAFEPEQFPLSKGMVEIAVVGRSNVGKSSLINHLLKNKHLAKTSATPGKTQSLNFYAVDEALLLVDLPGYGFAHATDTVKRKWATLIQHYLEKRKSLKLILFLFDVRREPVPEDCTFLQWAHARKIPCLLLFTKSDKLNASEKLSRPTHLYETFLHFLPGAPFAFLPYSIKDPRARMKLIKTISEQLSSHIS